MPRDMFVTYTFILGSGLIWSPCQFRDKMSSLTTKGIRCLTHLGEGSTTAGVVNDFLDDSADIAVAFGIVKGSQLSSTLAVGGVRLEDTTRLPLSTDNATHLDKL